MQGFLNALIKLPFWLIFPLPFLLSLRPANSHSSWRVSTGLQVPSLKALVLRTLVSPVPFLDVHTSSVWMALVAFTWLFSKVLCPHIDLWTHVGCLLGLWFQFWWFTDFCCWFLMNWLYFFRASLGWQEGESTKGSHASPASHTHCQHPFTISIPHRSGTFITTNEPASLSPKALSAL